MPKKYVVYTALFGDYDSLTDVPSHDTRNIDFICFTDADILSEYGWKIIKVKHSEFGPSMANRYYKLHPHLFFSEYQASLYVDANIKLTSSPYDLIEKYMDKSIFTMPKHAQRDCIYAEAKECIIQKKETNCAITKQLSKYSFEGMPKNYGLGENNILIRSHNDEHVKKVMEQWWGELISESTRDQLSLAYVMWKNNLEFTFMSETSRNDNQYFSYQFHKKFINRTIRQKIKDKVIVLMRRIKYYRWCL